MQIFINAKPTETQATDLQQLSLELNLPAKGIAVALSNRMIPRTEWASTPLCENAKIVIIKAACGG